MVLVGYRTAAPTHLCVVQLANESADTKSARHGQFQDMERSFYWIEYFPFEIFFDGR